MIRQALRSFRNMAAGAVVAASVILSPAPAHAFWDTQKAWNDMLQFAVRKINAPGEFEIILGEVTKPEDGFALISTLQIKDSDGIWLDASNLLVDWSASALLRGRFTFETLSAEEIAVLRAPIGRGDPPAESADIAIAWPRPPVPIKIDALKIERLRIEGGLLPQDLEAKIDGAFSDIGDVQDARIELQRTDRTGDRIELTSKIDFDNLDIAINLKATELPGGLVAQMAGLPPDQALQVEVSTKGTPDALPFDLYADIGQIGIAEGEGVASWGDLITAKFDGTIKPGEETSSDWKRALGDAAIIKVDFAETSKGSYDLNSLEISSNALEVTGAGEVDAAANSIDMELDWGAKDIDALNAVIAPARVTELTGTAKAVGRLSSPKVDVNAKVSGLKASFGEADVILLRVDSEADAKESGKTGTTQRFTFEAKAENLALADEGLQKALGSSPILSGDGAFYGTENRLSLDTLAINAESVKLDGNAEYELATGAIGAELSGEARSLGPFFKAAGLPVDGMATVAFKLDGLQGGTLDRLFLNAQMQDLSSTDPDIAAALGGTAVLEVLLTESDADTVRVERGFFESEVLRAEAKGSISVPGDTADLALDWQIKNAEAIEGLIAPAQIEGAEGKATLAGSLSEPKVTIAATATGLGYQDYAVTKADIQATGQYNKDLRAPFSLSATLDGVETGDPELDAVIGTMPFVKAEGQYDTATGLLSLSESTIDLSEADVSLAGDIHLRKQTLGVTYDFKADNLAGFAGLVGEELNGSVDLSGSLKGPFSLPFVTAKGSARDLVYGPYSLAAADLDIETETAEEGAAPFRIDITAQKPRTGDAGLDALIGDTPTLKAEGTLDRSGPAIALEYLDANFAKAKARASGSVNVGTQLMDVTFDVDARGLDALTPLLGTKVAGSIKAKGTASGAFTAPQVDATIDGSGLRYGDYSVRLVSGIIDVEQAPSGFAPFNIDIEASDIRTGDTEIDKLLSGESIVKANGQFNQSEQALKIEAAQIRGAGAKLDASGDIAMLEQRLDVVFDLKADDLAPFSALAGKPLDGSISAKGTATGRFTSPALDVTLSGKGLKYDAYAATSIDGAILFDAEETGFAPFKVDVRANGLSLGDPALDDLLDGGVRIDAEGGFDRSAQKLKLDRGKLISDAATADVKGSVDLASQKLDITYDLNARNLSVAEPLVGAELGGSLTAKGTAKGPFNVPSVNTTLSGKKLNYGDYQVDSIDGAIAMGSPKDGRLPFDIDVRASGIRTGDAALDDALGDAVTLDVAGSFDQKRKRLRLTRGNIDSDIAKGAVTGLVDLTAQTLDLTYDVDAQNFDVLGPIVGAELGGSFAAKGTAKGPFNLPAVNTTLSGTALRYGDYQVADIDGSIVMDTAQNGAIPFDIDVRASGIRTGDAALDQALGGTASIDAAGSFNQKRQRLRLARANLESDIATGSVTGAVDLTAKTLDLTYDLDARNLAAIAPIVGADIAGSAALKGTAKGPFTIPAIKARLDGQSLHYQTYSLASLTGNVSVGETGNGPAPFTISVIAGGLRSGDPSLDMAIGDTVTVDANGLFDVESQKITLNTGTLSSDFADADVSGTVDLKNQRLDVALDVDASDLAPFSAIAGQPVSGAISLQSTAKGPFVIPEIASSVSAAGLGYGPYAVGELVGSINLGSQNNGFAPFSADLWASGLALGNPELEAALGQNVTLRSDGAVNIDGQRIRLDSATLASNAATLQGSGSIDLKAQILDVTFGADVQTLSAFGPLAGADIGGSFALNGTAQGPFIIPQINASIAGISVRYGAYSIGRLDGSVAMASPDQGVLPFDITLNAAGLRTGDERLDASLGETVRIAARGGFDQSAPSVQLDSATLQSDVADISASGFVDLGAKTLDVSYDVTAGEIAGLSVFVGTDIGGSLAAAGTISGPFSAPGLATTLEGRSLYYQQYSVGSVTGRVSFSPASAGFGPFDVDVQAAGIRTGDPSLDFALEGGASVIAKGAFDASAQRLRLDEATASTRFANASANGTVDLGAKLVNVSFALDANDLSPLTGIVGTPLGGSLAATGSVNGPFTAPVINLKANGGGLYFDKYSVGGLNLDLEMPGTQQGYMPFTLRGTATQPRIGNPQIEAVLGETVTVFASGVFDPNQTILRLTDSQITAAIGTVRAFGDVDITNKILKVRYAVDVVDLSLAEALAGKPLAGSARVNGWVRGPFSDPSTTGRLDGQGIMYDRYNILSISADYELQRLVSGPTGAVSLNAQTDLGPLTANARFDLTGDRVQIDSLSVDGLGLNVSANFRTTPNGTLDGTAMLNATDLAQLGAFLGQDIAGQATGTVTLNDELGRQNASFDLRGTGLRYGPAASPTVLFNQFEARGNVADALGRDPYMDVTASGIDGKLQVLPVNRIDVTAKGTLSALDTNISAKGGALGSDRVETTARLNLVNTPKSAVFSRLSIAYQGRQLAIVRPFVVEEVPPGGWRLTGLDARVEDGELVGSAEYSPSGIVANITMRNVPMILASLAGTDQIRSGRLNGKIDIDTRGTVRGNFAVEAANIRLNGAQLDDPFNLNASGTMDGTALNLTAQMTGAQLIKPFTASARIPLITAPGSPLPALDYNAPFSGQADWDGDVSEIWAFVPVPDHILSGPIVLRARAGGTLAAPSLSGGAQLTGGRYSNIEFGTLLTDLNATADFTQDGRVVFDLTANDGVSGTVAAGGSYIVSSATLDTRLTLNNAALVRRDDLTAVISGEATAVSQGRDIKVDGNFRSNYVELRLIGGFGSSLTVIDAIPVGKTAPLYIPPAEESADAQKIFLNVSVSLPNRVFVRGRGLDSEWGGQIDVTGSVNKPRVVGAIERRRGVLDLLGRQFELSIGEVRFSGDLNPFVQVRLQREANDITGWIEVIGTVPDIDLNFGSIPDLPSGEVLPRLLFGRSQQSLTALEAAQLAAGVATLLSGKAGVIDGIRDAVGVDVLRVESDKDGGTAVITGKYLRDEVFVGAKQNLQSGSTSGLVEIEVFDNFEIEAELGSEEAKGSVGWQIEY